jgi:hypothetical protein
MRYGIIHSCDFWNEQGPSLYDGNQFLEMTTYAIVNEISSAVDSHNECIDQSHVMVVESLFLSGNHPFA